MTFSNKPLPPETCSCGAQWYPCFNSAELVERDRQAFRDAHAPCRNTWQRCPICEGRGFVPCGFYTGPAQTSTAPEQCRTCTGSGLLARPSSAGVQLEAEEASTDA